MAYSGIKRKVFVSFFQGDKKEVDEFIDKWTAKEGVFTAKVLGASDNDAFIDSGNPEYVMGQIRQKYLGDSSVTIVLLGSCTHSRRYVDWEIKSSLRRGLSMPNGLIGILLPSKQSAHLPARLADNWNKEHKDCYARYYPAPSSADQLRGWIEEAYIARTMHAKLIVNSQEMMKYNATCSVCKLTH